MKSRPPKGLVTLPDLPHDPKFSSLAARVREDQTALVEASFLEQICFCLDEGNMEEKPFERNVAPRDRLDTFRSNEDRSDDHQIHSELVLHSAVLDRNNVCRAEAALPFVVPVVLEFVTGHLLGQQRIGEESLRREGANPAGEERTREGRVSAICLPREKSSEESG